MALGIYMPTYGRANKLKAVIDNIKQATKHPYKLYFGVEPEDRETILVLKDLKQNIIYNHDESTYSNALQAIYEATDEPIFLWANDDFHFLQDWDEEPLKMFDNPDISVLGLHDGNPNTKYFSISLVRRKYIKEQSGVVDMPNRVLYPYEHNFVDDELTETAQSRGVWDKYPGPCIEHRHPSFTWLGEFPDDDTYRKNGKTITVDLETFNNRRRLWQ